MAEQTNQSDGQQSSSTENQVGKTDSTAPNGATGANQQTIKRAYVKPTLRKFSQIDYVTAYGVD